MHKRENEEHKNEAVYETAHVRGAFDLQNKYHRVKRDKEGGKKYTQPSISPFTPPRLHINPAIAQQNDSILTRRSWEKRGGKGW